MKELETQFSDVQKALGNLDICIELAIDDKEQFIKEYGSRMYATLCKIKAEISINTCKIYDILYK